MRKPLRDKGGKSAVSKPAFFPAPVQGWYVGANLADAPAGTAYLLENAFPQLDHLRIRGGSSSFATGLGSPVRSLFTWVGGANSKMFAAAGGKIYDASNAGAVGAAAISGQTSDYWESVQFSPTGSTSRVLIVNGVDAPQNFDGATWSTAPAITGMAGVPAFASSFKSRLFLSASNSLNLYYLGLAAIGGAATLFEMGGIFKLGGSILCHGTWAIDASSGVYESFVVVTTEGEVAMLTGDGPSNWVVSGTYKVSRPLGKRCLMKAGGDLAIMTEDGIVPLSKVQQLDQVALQNVAVTKPIAPHWRDTVVSRTGLQGWQITIWPLQSMGIIAVPSTSADVNFQYVANVRTGAWARYTGWDGLCFCVYGNNLYFGTSGGVVMQGEVLGSDNGSAYTMTVFPSYTDLSAPGYRKQVKMARALVQCPTR